MALPISIIIPVGPQEEYKQYLDECIDSALENDPQEVIIVDDMAFLDANKVTRKSSAITYRRNSWLCGCAMSWNFGIAEARNELCLMMGSDDKLLPGCLSACVDTFKAYSWLDAWYNITCIIETGEVVDAFNNAATVTRGLWKKLGGFAPSAWAAPDGWAISVMMINMPERLLQVEKGTPYYWCRVHSAQDTPRVFGKYMNAAIEIRDIDTRTWVEPEWTRKIR